MDVAQNVFDMFFERGRGDDDRDEETEAIVSVVRRIAPHVPGHLAERYPGIAGRTLHYVFGGAFSIAYAYTRRRRPTIAAANGCLFGAALWFVSDVVLIPGAHFGRPLFRYSRAERGNALVSHLVYGSVVEAILRAV